MYKIIIPLEGCTKWIEAEVDNELLYNNWIDAIYAANIKVNLKKYIEFNEKLYKKLMLNVIKKANKLTDKDLLLIEGVKNLKGGLDAYLDIATTLGKNREIECRPNFINDGFVKMVVKMFIDETARFEKAIEVLLNEEV